MVLTDFELVFVIILLYLMPLICKHFWKTIKDMVAEKAQIELEKSVEKTYKQPC